MLLFISLWTQSGNFWIYTRKAPAQLRLLGIQVVLLKFQLPVNPQGYGETPVNNNVGLRSRSATNSGVSALDLAVEGITCTMIAGTHNRLGNIQCGQPTHKGCRHRVSKLESSDDDVTGSGWLDDFRRSRDRDFLLQTSSRVVHRPVQQV